jgi:hypothetical protein
MKVEPEPSVVQGSLLIVPPIGHPYTCGGQPRAQSKAKVCSSTQGTRPAGLGSAALRKSATRAQRDHCRTGRLPTNVKVQQC